MGSSYGIHLISGTLVDVDVLLVNLFQESSLPSSCEEIKMENPDSEDGVYTIQPSNNSATYQVYCEMTTEGGGWTVMAYLRKKKQWDYKVFEDRGVVGNTDDGFAYGATLKQMNATYTKKLIIYLALEEEGEMIHDSKK